MFVAETTIDFHCMLACLVGSFWISDFATSSNTLNRFSLSDKRITLCTHFLSCKRGKMDPPPWRVPVLLPGVGLSKKGRFAPLLGRGCVTHCRANTGWALCDEQPRAASTHWTHPVQKSGFASWTEREKGESWKTGITTLMACLDGCLLQINSKNVCGAFRL